MSKKLCSECQSLFVPKRPNQLTCSPKCRKLRTRRRDLECERRRYHSDPELRARKIAASAQRFATDPVYREQMSAQKKAKRAAARAVREAEKAATAAARAEATRERNRQRSHDRYHGLTPEARRLMNKRRNEKARAYSAAWAARKRAEDPEYFARQQRARLLKKKAAAVTVAATSAGPA